MYHGFIYKGGITYTHMIKLGGGAKFQLCAPFNMVWGHTFLRKRFYIIWSWLWWSLRMKTSYFSISIAEEVAIYVHVNMPSISCIVFLLSVYDLVNASWAIFRLHATTCVIYHVYEQLATACTCMYVITVCTWIVCVCSMCM